MLPSLQPRAHFRNGFSGVLRALFSGARTAQENRPFSWRQVQAKLLNGGKLTQSALPSPHERNSHLVAARGPAELELNRQSGMRTFPPRLPEQPIFYPVTTEEYAVKIARDWNVRDSGAGYVTCFEVLKNFLVHYQVQDAGGRAHREYWIPADQVDAFNQAIVGQIKIVRSFP